MADKTGIEWCDATWNPIRGCSRVSEGCRYCYAELIAARFSKPGNPYFGIAGFKNGQPHWTGDIQVVHDKMDQPIRWKRPRIIFVNSMSDLFHENVGSDTIFEIFDIMANKAPHHYYIVLTKRPQRAVALDMEGMLDWQPNIWMGVSVEDTKTVHRLDDLELCKAQVKILSAEPLLEPFDHMMPPYLKWLDWVIVGGESGAKARPMKEIWAYTMGMRCIEHHVPFFFKQMGGRGGKNKGSNLLYKQDGTPFEQQFPKGCEIHNPKEEIRQEELF